MAADAVNLTARPRILVIPLSGGQPLYSFERLPGADLGAGWSPDYKGVNYLVTRNGVTNVWRQALNGGQPKQMTHFEDGKIYSFAWSRDHKQLAVVRVYSNSDAD